MLYGNNNSHGHHHHGHHHHGHHHHGQGSFGGPSVPHTHYFMPPPPPPGPKPFSFDEIFQSNADVVVPVIGKTFPGTSTSKNLSVNCSHNALPALVFNSMSYYLAANTTLVEDDDDVTGVKESNFNKNLLILSFPGSHP
jgi:hypothetical protein